MPRIIRQALGEKIRQDAELQAFLRHFHTATNIPAEFVHAYDNGECGTPWTGSPLCARLMNDPAGRRLRQRFRQRLIEVAQLAPATQTCESGLIEAAVPMRAAGQTLGYLVTGGFIAVRPEQQQLNRARHLLSRAGVALDADELAELSERTPVVPVARQEALVQLLNLGAEHLTAKFTERLTRVDARIPEIVDRTCRIVHAEFAHKITMPAVARRLAVSEGHLSRTFHRATGLRLVEYVARFRAERARAMLLEGGHQVTEVAFACGFQSLSQFNRVFRAQFGQSPRAAHHDAGPSAAYPA
jgi:AraC-like DNA-binding protein/ligand-binding sensor protein